MKSMDSLYDFDDLSPEHQKQVIKSLSHRLKHGLWYSLPWKEVRELAKRIAKAQKFALPQNRKAFLLKVVSFHSIERIKAGEK